MSQSFVSRVQSRYLTIRRHVLPWCMRRGCWQDSYLASLRGQTHRGNLCALHMWESIQAMIAEVESDEPSEQEVAS